MRSRFRVCSAVFAALALAGCEGHPVAHESAGWLHASIQGDDVEPYSGSGIFTTSSDGAEGSRPWFVLASHGLGASAGRSLVLFGSRGDLPSVGRYDLGEPANDDAEFSVIYSSEQGANLYGYRAEEGELEIMESTPERIRGRVRFTAVRYRSCTLREEVRRREITCSMESDPAPDAHRVQVGGSFEAIRGRSCVPPMPGGVLVGPVCRFRTYGL